MKTYLLLVIAILIGSGNVFSKILNPMVITNFDAKYLNGNQLVVNWKSLIESNTENYILEFSSDGIQFDSIAQQTPLYKDDIERHYTLLTHINYISENQYFRLKIIDKNKNEQFSTIVNIYKIAGVGNPAFELYPNPSKHDHDVFIKITENTDDPIDIKIYRFSGRLICDMKISHLHNGIINMNEILHPLKHGYYIIYVTVNDKSHYKQLIVH
jgi:hypothetical protein